MRRPFIAGNWKLHKTVVEALELVNTLKVELAGIVDADIVVAPVFTALAPVAEAVAGSNLTVAAQNCYPAKSGAFTGEVSPPLIKDVGCRQVIVGHSERRQIFGETDVFINAKVKALIAEGLMAIFCIGETLDERESGRMFEILRQQVTEGLKDLDAAAMASVVVAYEPVWAIGTGKTASDEQAQEAHAFIRGLLQDQFGEKTAETTRIIYGGSVKPDNVDGLMAMPDIDGTLVGGASLKAADFIRIARFRRS
ncbi:MAG TPA: triose-phosphate isomerase [Desulfuromonadales bacterium]|nr:triose-phosphate isomerase [Desulfuromonadales bacterium]